MAEALGIANDGKKDHAKKKKQIIGSKHDKVYS
jgi:hypothetical protein